jgi:hypothetical protein
VVETPNNAPGGMITAIPPVNSSGINAIALGPDGTTFYAADTAEAKFYKSMDAGITWFPEIGTRLSAKLPAGSRVWNLAVSPDDANFILTVTGDNITGPKQVFYSGDGGNNWQTTGLPLLGPTEYISCLDISKMYGPTGQVRDIAVGTRSTAGTGRVFFIQYNSSSMGSWNQQNPGGTLPGNIVSMKFSPGYVSDLAIVVITTTALPLGTFLNIGKHDPPSNTTLWNATSGYTGYPVPLNNPLTVPNRIIVSDSGTLIKCDLELPSDFLASDVALRGCFASLLAQNDTAVLYINPNLSTQPYEVTPPEASAPLKRFSSIAYKGTQATGILLAGEAPALNSRGLVNVWQCANAQSATPNAAMWVKSDGLKSPSGGGNSGRANALLSWSDDGSLLYCSTSSENAVAGGTGVAPGQWPFSQLASQRFDESAFSRSADSGITWNQVGLINTRIDQLSDVAAIEIPPEISTPLNGSVLYLASLNMSVTENYTFDSVWRSTSDPLGQVWERVLLRNTSDSGTILRINPRPSDSGLASSALIFADLGTENITYSADRGQLWEIVPAGATVNDISLATDTRMYVLEDPDVRQVNRGGSGWIPGLKLNTNLLGNGHTICTPLMSGGATDIVIVGSDFQESSVAWADFSQIIARFTDLKPVPLRGNVHVVADSQYDQSPFIYAGINIDQPVSTDGSIYRWQVGKSTDWDRLEPPDLAFYGVEMLNDVLYGAFDFDKSAGDTREGVDRTLYARVKVPPPPEWNDLKACPSVHFTREPSSLKVSSNAHNTLWAIDNQAYNYTGNTGRLWMYIDSVAKLGPWPTSPATGSFIGSDPSSGRGQQIDFKWRPLTDIFSYDVLIAKDVNFTLLLGQNLNLSPLDGNTGAWIVTPADQQQPGAWISPGVLEVGRPYYWKVRGRSSGINCPGFSSDIVYSPWSPAMLFYIKPGFIVKTDYPGPTLLTPIDGPCASCKSPVRFSWTPIKNAATYEFILASDPELKDVVIKSTTNTTAFEYKDKLQPGKAYYWQVKATAPVISDSSPVGTFAIASLAPAPPKDTGPPRQPGPAGAVSDIWIWVIIVIAVLLLMLINLYAFLSRNKD